MPNNGGSRRDWLHTCTTVAMVILAIVVACFRMGDWLEGKLATFRETLTELESEHAAFRNRLTLNGWSRSDQEEWRNDLEKSCEHPVPHLPPMRVGIEPRAQPLGQRRGG